MKELLLNCPCGTMKGTTDGKVNAFKGIRYAIAERWQYPQEVTSWQGTYDATQYGNCCWQPRSFTDESTVKDKAFYFREFRQGEVYTYSEDCLNLNIWTPSDAHAGEKKPVIFYIHGGAFVGGCGFERPFNGPVWPSRDVVAVTINYRLGPLGFMALPEFASPKGTIGNYGLYDQLTALYWVKHNIAAFGGDADNITLMGQSSGAMSVQQLVDSSLTEGLIAKAVMSSGGGAGSFNPVDKENVYPFWHAVADKLGGTQAMRTGTAFELFSAWEAVKAEHPQESFFATCPVVDGMLVIQKTSDCLKQGTFAKIPYLMGSNSEDMMPSVLYQMCCEWTLAQYKTGIPAYMYHFSRQLPGDTAGAWHSADLWYWFGTLQNCWRPMTDWDQSLSHMMVDYLCNFARCGDPNGDGLPSWETVTPENKAVMVLNDHTAQMKAADKISVH